jgi:hypothetical protein
MQVSGLFECFKGCDSGLYIKVLPLARRGQGVFRKSKLCCKSPAEMDKDFFDVG